MPSSPRTTLARILGRPADAGGLQATSLSGGTDAWRAAGRTVRR